MLLHTFSYHKTTIISLKNKKSETWSGPPSIVKKQLVSLKNRFRIAKATFPRIAKKIFPALFQKAWPPQGGVASAVAKGELVLGMVTKRFGRRHAHLSRDERKMERLFEYGEFDEERDVIYQRDRLGRIRREYFPRIHPLERYREKKFQARYRLSKNTAAALADDFGGSEYATCGRAWGGGIPHRDRVSTE